jgi:hypothetical protein
MRHNLSYIAYGSFPDKSSGDEIPIRRKFAAIEGPMFGICCKSVMSARQTFFKAFVSNVYFRRAVILHEAGHNQVHRIGNGRPDLGGTGQE